MGLLIFEDAQVRRLAPITLTRAAYDVSCGGICLTQCLNRLNESVSALVRPHLVEVQQRNRPDWTLNHSGWFAGDSNEPLLAVNARLLGSPDLIRRLNELRSTGQGRVLRRGDTMLVGWFPTGMDAGSEVKSTATYDELLNHLIQVMTSADLAVEDCSDDVLPTVDLPYDVVRHQLTFMSDNLQSMIADGSYREIADGLFAGEDVTVTEQLAIDTRNGPIVLQSGSAVRPFAFMRGPVLVGSSSRVNEHASIKDGVCIGHTVKVGGELERATIEPYTNKGHVGFLGHSYVGSWANLGAGTSTSNLKNTYGKVNVRYDGEKIQSGMQFLGCVIGDYSKSAINTSIYTGLTIGAASTLYGTVTENVPSFVNYGRSLGSVTEMSVDAMIATQGRVFRRRNVEQRDCDLQLLRDVFEMTSEERVGLAASPPKFGK